MTVEPVVTGGARTLPGVRVLVTRPLARGEGLVRAIERRGGKVLRFPVVEIARPGDANAARQSVARLGEFDAAIFTSVNAVDPVAELVLELDLSTVKGQLDVLAVGDATRRALRRRGWNASAPPGPPHDSEALLAMPRLAPHAVGGQRIIVFKGEGGRGLLEAELECRGAKVHTADVYRRMLPRADGAWINELGAAGRIDAIVVTSAEGACNLFQLLGEDGRGWLPGASFVTVSERVAGALRRCGVRGVPVVAAGANDDALVEALERIRS